MANLTGTSISIALATYNGATFLEQQLASLARQTLPPAELVVTDDASADATIAILETFAATAPFPVRIHRNPVRLGYRGNFMKAMALCQSDLVALCDQDDVWAEEKLATAVAAFSDPGVLLFFHGAMLIDAAGRDLGKAQIMSLPERSAPLSFYPLINPFGFSIVIRRSLIDLAPYWTGSMDTMDQVSRMAHDQWVFFLASVFGDIVYSDLMLVHYRQHGNNTYGWSGGWNGIGERVAALFNDNGVDHAKFARSAAARGRLLRRMAAELTAPRRELAEVSAAYYEALAARLELRGEIYLAPRLHRRVVALLRLARLDGYGKGNLWNIGPKAAVKDIGLGILLRSLMRQVERKDKTSIDFKVDSTPGGS